MKLYLNYEEIDIKEKEEQFKDYLHRIMIII